MDGTWCNHQLILFINQFSCGGGGSMGFVSLMISNLAMSGISVLGIDV